jgi:tetratricopeptide (TPR) repeat protein
VHSKNRLARICQTKGNFSKAEGYYKQILKLLKPGDKRLLAMMFRNYAGLYLLQNKLKKAEEVAIRALTLARETKNFTSIRDEAEMLCKIYNAENNNKSVEICALYTTMNDSVKNEEAKKTAGFVKFKEEYEKHETQLKAEETKKRTDKPLTETKMNNILIFSVIIILMLIICLFLFKRFK